MNGRNRMGWQVMLGSLFERALSLACSKWVKVRGDSMHPTLSDGAWVRVDRRAYLSLAPRRFDVVLIEHPQRAGFWEIKRVVGMPGERVELIGGVLMVDRVEVQDVVATPDPQSYEWQLRDDEYVVLGDNRRQSTDSREFGAVDARRIVGRVVLR